MNNKLIEALLEDEIALKAEAALDAIKSESLESSKELSRIINLMDREQIESATQAYTEIHRHFKAKKNYTMIIGAISLALGDTNEIVRGMSLGLIEAFLVGYSLGIKQKE